MDIWWCMTFNKPKTMTPNSSRDNGNIPLSFVVKYLNNSNKSRLLIRSKIENESITYNHMCRRNFRPFDPSKFQVYTIQSHQCAHGHQHPPICCPTLSRLKVKTIKKTLQNRILPWAIFILRQWNGPYPCMYCALSIDIQESCHIFCFWKHSNEITS